MAHLTPVGGDHIGGGRQAGGAAELRHHFAAGEALLSAARIFRIGQHALQLFANLMASSSQAPFGSRVTRACGKRFARR
jgi:hypothetical protein